MCYVELALASRALISASNIAFQVLTMICKELCRRPSKQLDFLHGVWSDEDTCVALFQAP